MAAPNLSELAKKRFEVVRSPDGRITNYYDKQTGRTLSQTEFNNFMQQQSGLPAPFQAFEPNSIGSIMGRLDEMVPFAEQLGLGQPGVLPLDQQRPDVLGAAVTGGKGGKAAKAAPREYPLATRPVIHDAIPEPDMPMPTVRGTPNPIGPQGPIVPPSGANVPRLGQSPMEMMPGQRGNFNSIGSQGPIIPSSGAEIPRLPQGSPNSLAVRAGQGPAANPVIDVVARGNPNPIGPQGPIVTPSGSEIPRLASSVPPFPPPAGRAPMPPMPPPPPAGASPAAVKSWFGKLSGKQKAALGVAGAGAVSYAVINKAADTARNQSAPSAQPEQGAAQGGWDIAGGLVDTAVKNALAPSQQPKAAPMPSRAANVLRAASAAQGQAGPQPQAAVAATATDKVPVTTSGRPDYNYYAEMMNAADRNDAYARDLINLKEQARMAAIDAGARGEKFRFVPVKDYMNNRIIFVNAGGNDVVLDMNDPRQGVEYQKLLEKSGVDAATMTDWIHRSSKPMLRYMQPAGGNRDVMPDFGYMRRSVELGADAPAMPAMPSMPAPTTPPSPELKTEAMPTPTATAPTRPEPQPTSVAAVAPTVSTDGTDKQLPWTDDQRSVIQGLRSFRLKSSRFGG